MKKNREKGMPERAAENVGAKKVSFENTEARNRAFVAQALAELRECDKGGKRISRKELVDRVLAMRPPYYYVEATYAERMVRKVLRRKDKIGVESERMQMWRELAERVRRLMGLNPEMRLTQALWQVLNFEKPSRYFMARGTANRLLDGYVHTERFARDRR